MLAQRLVEYHYDPLDRLAGHVIADQARMLRFYRFDRFYGFDQWGSQIMGQTQTSLLRVEGQLLSCLEAEPPQHRQWLIGTDRQGSVLEGVDSAQRVNRAYSPYGTTAPLAIAPSLPAFMGETPDPVTGHYLLGNGGRAFNPVLMRFNTPDNLSPFAEGGLNAYAYCAGDPVNRFDPSGHMIKKFSLFTRRDRVLEGEIASHSQAGIVQTVIQSMSRSTEDLGPTPAPRQYLRERLGSPERQTLFGKRLSAVNDNLASHANNDLTQQQAEQYARLAKDVSGGRISSTTAHVNAGLAWLSEMLMSPRPSVPAVGVAMNFTGAISAAATEANQRKTGAALYPTAFELRKKSTDIRQ